MNHTSLSSLPTTGHYTSVKPLCVRAAFTLIELLAVIAIIGVLLGMIVGLSGYAMRMSQESKAKAEIEVWSRALEEYMLEKGSFPEFLTDIEDDEIPEDVGLADPWGNDYQYSRSAIHAHAFTLYSMGPDGLHGDDAENADDIISGR